ncbi:MAG: ATP-binding protein, partial [Candidatus Limnocylindria bacterium]
MAFLRSLRVLDVLGALIAVAAVVASVVVWDFGRVHLGMTLRSDGEQVVVHDVTPDGNAHRNGFRPWTSIIDISTVNGAAVERGDPIGSDLEQSFCCGEGSGNPFESIGGELGVIDAEYRLPVEAVDPQNIQTVTGGDLYVEEGWVNVNVALDRGALEGRLFDSAWIAAVGVLVGAAVWLVLSHLVPGEDGRRHAFLAGIAAAIPFLLAPVVAAGRPEGIYAGYLLPIGVAMLLGWSLAGGPGQESARRGGAIAAAVMAVVAGLLVVRYMTSPTLADNSPIGIFAATAAVTLIPGIRRVANDTSRRRQSEYLSLALVPVAAMTALTATNPQPAFPLILLGTVLGWQLVPSSRVVSAVTRAWASVRPASPMGAASVTPAAARVRNGLLIGLLGLIATIGLMQSSGGVALIGLGLAVVVGWAVAHGALGPDWIDAAIPLAVAVGIPVCLLAFDAWSYGGAMGWAGTATALGGLGVAHVLASRHSDPAWRGRLFLGSVGLVVLTALLGGMNLQLAIVVAGLVPLVPGLPAAFAEERGEERALTSRLETLAVTLTPGAAATVLIPSTGGLLLGAWLVALVVWRRFTLAPLLGLAQRTQLQRDVAVAAAETERARLAADLHDDALQQLTMLVRTLDEGGQKEAADEAREIATKLRSVVGDLRLPILDDLGAGAALEWLVERVEPLAGGPVKLERSDETRPPANVELAVFRVAQEALTNAIKHGRPPIAVRYDVRADGRVSLAIDDAGEGIGSEAAEDAPKEGHFGLVNMQQRAEQIGALLDVRRWPAGGTRVALEWRP